MIAGYCTYLLRSGDIPEGRGKDSIAADSGQDQAKTGYERGSINKPEVVRSAEASRVSFQALFSVEKFLMLDKWLDGICLEYKEHTGQQKNRYPLTWAESFRGESR